METKETNDQERNKQIINQDDNSVIEKQNSDDSK